MDAISTQIELDERGVAWLTGANIKVIEVVLDKLAHGWSPEEMHFQHPGLSLAQIHAALAYYYENQPQMDQEIERQRAEIAALRQEAGDSGFQQKLARLKKPN